MFKYLFLFCFSILVCVPGLAGDFPERPNPPRLVNDYANLLKATDRDYLEAKLAKFADTTSTQIAVVIMASVPNGYDYSDYAERLAEKWAIGQKGKDNGVLLFLGMKEHKVWIATGYGVEASLPDITAKLIIENYIVPAFKAGDFIGGLDKGTTAIMQAVSGQFKPEVHKKNKGLPFVFIGAILLMILLSIFGRRGGGNNSSTFNRGGYYGGAGWGGSGGRGSWSGGGGFGGFGGGGFGGGGAGGSW